MRAFVPAPVVQDFLGGPVETHFRIAADVCSTIGHRHGDIVRRGVDVKPEIADALIEIADRLAHLVHPADLRMRHQARSDHKVMRQRGIACVLISLYATGVDIVRGRVVRVVLMLVENAKQERMLLVRHVIEPADILLFIRRRGEGEARIAVRIGQRRDGKQLQSAWREAALRDDVPGKRLSRQRVINGDGIGGEVAFPLGGRERLYTCRA